MLKLGNQTGSMINHLMSRSTKNQPKVEVGVGSTILMWSDRKAATIISVQGDGISIGTIITVQEDNVRVISGSIFDGSAEYEYSPNPDGYTQTYRLNKKGFWERIVRNTETGRWNKQEGSISIGVRQQYRDPSF